VNNFGKNLALWIVIGLLLVALFNLFQTSANRGPQSTLAFSDFLNDVKRGQVSDVTIQGNTINGHFTDGRAFSFSAPNRLITKGVRIDAAPVSPRGLQAILAFSDSLNDVDSGQVADVTIHGNGITGHFSDGDTFSFGAPKEEDLKGIRITVAPVPPGMSAAPNEAQRRPQPPAAPNEAQGQPQPPAPPNAAAENAQLWTSLPPKLLKTTTASDLHSVTATWQFDKPERIRVAQCGHRGPHR